MTSLDANAAPPRHGLPAGAVVPRSIARERRPGNGERKFLQNDTMKIGRFAPGWSQKFGSADPKVYCEIFHIQGSSDAKTT